MILNNGAYYRMAMNESMTPPGGSKQDVSTGSETGPPWIGAPLPRALGRFTGREQAPEGRPIFATKRLHRAVGTSPRPDRAGSAERPTIRKTHS